MDVLQERLSERERLMPSTITGDWAWLIVQWGRPWQELGELESDWSEV